MFVRIQVYYCAIHIWYPTASRIIFSRYDTTLNTRNGYQPKLSSKGALHSYRLHRKLYSRAYIRKLDRLFSSLTCSLCLVFIINFDSLTLIYLGMRQVRQSQFFRIFQQKVPSVFSNISLGQFGPKTGSGRIALWALLHRRKLLKIEHFCFFALQKRPSFQIRCCKIPVYRFHSKYAPILPQF